MISPSSVCERVLGIILFFSKGEKLTHRSCSGKVSAAKKYRICRLKILEIFGFSKRSRSYFAIKSIVRGFLLSSLIPCRIIGFALTLASGCTRPKALLANEL